MVSAWWLVVAIVTGVFAGIFLIAIVTMLRSGREGDPVRPMKTPGLQPWDPTPLSATSASFGTMAPGPETTSQDIEESQALSGLA